MCAAPQHDRNRSYLPSAAAARAACDMLRPATSGHGQDASRPLYCLDPVSPWGVWSS